MGRLYFKFGVMGSSKSASALMCRYNYVQKNMNVLLLKPKIDTRFNENQVTSRIGLSAPCYAFSKDENLEEFFMSENKLQKINVVIVDECQFCTKKQIEQLRNITDKAPVICYGLLTNFKGELFEGSKRLIEISDSFSEIKSICACGKKATMNIRLLHDVMITEGEEIELGSDEKYKGVCYSCYKKEKRKSNIYNKIIKYLNIFKNKDDAGHWSCDTTLDNYVMERPYVIYDEDVTNFIHDFKKFEIKDPKQTLFVSDNVEELKKISMKDKDFDFVMALISFVLKLEKNSPGLLKALIEEDVMTKWLKQIKKSVDHEDFD